MGWLEMVSGWNTRSIYISSGTYQIFCRVASPIDGTALRVTVDGHEIVTRSACQTPVAGKAGNRCRRRPFN